MTNKSKVIDSVQYKQCSNCRRYKPIGAFNKMKDGRFGVMGECRICTNKRTKQYVKEHPECHERYNRQRRERYKNEPTYRALVKDRDRKFKGASPEYNREYQKKWRRTHPRYYDKYNKKQ